MAEFIKVIDKNGKTIYRNVTKNVPVKAESLPAALKEELDLSEPKTPIDEESILKIDGDGVVNADGTKKSTDEPEVDETEDEEEEEAYEAPSDVVATPVAKTPKEEAYTNPYRRTVPATEAGFGFPRLNGKTVDIFDLETPHTHLMAIEGKLVPLSKKSYETKSEAEVYDRLKELKLI